MGEFWCCLKDLLFKDMSKAPQSSNEIFCDQVHDLNRSQIFCYKVLYSIYALPKTAVVKLKQNIFFLIFEEHFEIVKDFSLYYLICSSQWSKRENKYSLYQAYEILKAQKLNNFYRVIPLVMVDQTPDLQTWQPVFHPVHNIILHYVATWNAKCYFSFDCFYTKHSP